MIWKLGELFIYRVERMLTICGGGGLNQLRIQLCSTHAAFDYIKTHCHAGERFAFIRKVRGKNSCFNPERLFWSCAGESNNMLLGIEAACKCFVWPKWVSGSRMLILSACVFALTHTRLRHYLYNEFARLLLVLLLPGLGHIF